MLAFMERSMKYLYALVHKFFIPRYDAAMPSGKALIVCGGHIGDAVLAVGCIRALTGFFSNQGNTTFILCSNAAKKVFEAAGEMNGAEILGDSYLDSPQSFPCFLKCVKRLKGMRFDIVSDLYLTPPTAAIVMLLSAGRIITVGHRNRERSFLKRIVTRAAYSKAVIVPPDTMVFLRHKALLEELGEKDYLPAIPLFQKENTESSPLRKAYIAVFLASSNPVRIWEPQKFAMCINEIIAKWGVNVVLTGGKAEEQAYQQIQAQLRYPEFVINKIMQTDLREWMDLIRGSLLVIGVDSGGIHVAASMQTPSICLSGLNAGEVCFPYRLAYVRDCDAVPICIYAEPKYVCNGCVLINGKYGSLNAECAKEIKGGRAILCLQKITVAQVMEKVDAFFRANSPEGS